MAIERITTTRDQGPLFAAADAGLPLLMERNGRRYYVVAEDRLDAFAAFIGPRIRSQILATPVLPSLRLRG